jgi:hypothetical protein
MVVPDRHTSTSSCYRLYLVGEKASNRAIGLMIQENGNELYLGAAFAAHIMTFFGAECRKSGHQK